MSKLQPFFAVRVVLTYEDGSTVQRDYVRGQQHLGRERFVSFALGDLIRTVGQVAFSDMTVEEIDFQTVLQNRRYQHTTHAEGQNQFSDAEIARFN
jgi:hypothetical protein